MCRSEERNTIQVFSIEPDQIKVKTLNDLEQKFDILRLDGTPQLSELASLTIVVSDVVLIPISTSLFDFRAFKKVLSH
jgi:cellulose biosynthesis protein BcsQ